MLHDALDFSGIDTVHARVIFSSSDTHVLYPLVITFINMNGTICEFNYLINSVAKLGDLEE